MKKKIYVLAAAALFAALSLTGCKSKEKVDLSGIHTTEAETMAPLDESQSADSAETLAESVSQTEDLTEETKESAGEDSASALSVKSKIATEKDGTISIEYPILSNLPSGSPEEEINKRIKEKATQILTAYEADPKTSTISIQCDVIALSRSKLTALWTGSVMTEGAAYASNVFYTLNMDLGTGELKGLSDYADAYTMAGYILSDDCTLVKSENQPEVLEGLKTYDIETLTSMLEKSDFTAEDSSTFPEVFSYENQGVIYVSVPVSHALGDYAVVKFIPDNK